MKRPFRFLALLLAAVAMVVLIGHAFAATLTTSNIGQAWKHSKQRNVFYNGSNFFVFYSKGATSLFFKAASTEAGLASAGEQTILNTTLAAAGEWDIYLINDTKFDLAYFNAATTAVVQTCQISGTSITCLTASATVSFSNGTTDTITVTRTPFDDRIWIAGRAGANTRVYSANQTGNSSGISTWTTELGSTTDANVANETTIIPYSGTGKVLFFFQRDPVGSTSDGIYSRTIIRGGGVGARKGVWTGFVANPNNFGNGIRISDSDFRYLYVDTNSDLIEAKWDGSTWNNTFSTVAVGTYKNPALSYNRFSGNFYAVYADSNDDIFYSKKTAGAWGTAVGADNDEADANSFPVTQMFEPPEGNPHCSSSYFTWGYRNANVANFDVIVGSLNIPTRCITGTVYRDEGRTATGINLTVALSVNGSGSRITDETGSGGEFSVGMAQSTGSVISIYLDNETQDAVTVSIASGATMTGVHLYQNRLIVRADSGSYALTNTHLSKGVQNADTDISGIYTVDGGVLNVKDDRALFVWAGKTFTPGGNVNVGSGVTIQGTLSAEANTVALSGAWLNKGTFTAGTSTVTLDGTSQTVSGATTFYNLQKTVTAADTLTFAANVQQVVSNALTLRGVAGNLLSLRSSVSALAAKLRLTAGGTQTLDYLDVKDNDASGGDELVCLTDSEGCVNSGNNTNWSFAAAAAAAAVLPTFVPIVMWFF